jgi:hypothetical protein
MVSRLDFVGDYVYLQGNRADYGGSPWSYRGLSRGSDGDDQRGNHEGDQVMRAPKEVDWDAVYDDRHLPDITMADHIRNAGPDPKISPEDEKRWLRTTLQVHERKKRIDTMEHGPKRTALKKQQRLEIDLLNREILITHVIVRAPHLPFDSILGPLSTPTRATHCGASLRRCRPDPNKKLG